jgi:hypothetical protein
MKLVIAATDASGPLDLQRSRAQNTLFRHSFSSAPAFTQCDGRNCGDALNDG